MQPFVDRVTSSVSFWNKIYCKMSENFNEGLWNFIVRKIFFFFKLKLTGWQKRPRLGAHASAKGLLLAAPEVDADEELALEWYRRIRRIQLRPCG